MPDINTGNPKRFQSAGVIEIWNTADSTAYTPLYIVPGSLDVAPGGSLAIPISDRGSLTTIVLTGDQRQTKISFKVNLTSNGLTGATDLLTLLRPADSGGKKALFKVVVKIPTNIGASTGDSMTITSCYLDMPPSYKAGGDGPNVDELSIDIMSQDSEPAYATY